MQKEGWSGAGRAPGLDDRFSADANSGILCLGRSIPIRSASPREHPDKDGSPHLLNIWLIGLRSSTGRSGRGSLGIVSRPTNRFVMAKERQRLKQSLTMPAGKSPRCIRVDEQTRPRGQTNALVRRNKKRGSAKAAPAFQLLKRITPADAFFLPARWPHPG